MTADEPKRILCIIVLLLNKWDMNHCFHLSLLVPSHWFKLSDMLTHLRPRRSHSLSVQVCTGNSFKAINITFPAWLCSLCSRPVDLNSFGDIQVSVCVRERVHEHVCARVKGEKEIKSDLFKRNQTKTKMLQFSVQLVFVLRQEIWKQTSDLGVRRRISGWT